jgi:hypothetical protein
MITKHDDFPHVPDYRVFMTWKENWCFTGVDLENAVGFVFHISLRPQQGEGIFSVKLDGQAPGERLRIKHVERKKIGLDPSREEDLSTESMSFKVITPHKKFSLRYEGSQGILDVEFTGRFEPFDFADGKKAPGSSTIGELGLHVFPFHHYEQGLQFTASFTPSTGLGAGKAIKLKGFGNRDHSWGFRNDFGFQRHHWLCANFKDRYVQGSIMLEQSYPDVKFGGFIGRETGNVPVFSAATNDAYWEFPPNVPIGELNRSVQYSLTDADGNTHLITAHLDRAVARNYLNARHPDQNIVYEDCQVFCPFTDDATGEEGSGLLEIGKIVITPTDS